MKLTRIILISFVLASTAMLSITIGALFLSMFTDLHLRGEYVFLSLAINGFGLYACAYALQARERRTA